MKDLGNIFSVLSLDVGDDKDQTAVSAPTDARKQSGKKNPVKEQISEADEECPPAEGSSERFRSPLVWIDLEMTGLNIDVDRILEIACIITDGKLTHLAEGPDLIIHQSKECLDNMGEWCQNHHSASGMPWLDLSYYIWTLFGAAHKSPAELGLFELGFSPKWLGSWQKLGFTELKISQARVELGLTEPEIS